MNVNPIVIAALASLSLPVEPDEYMGVETDYITFNYSDERPVLYADDIDTIDETIIQVHYFTKGNPQTNIKLIRKLLRAAGFTVTGTVRLYESDTKYRHSVIECWIEEVIND